jgi:hypothetical protein
MLLFRLSVKPISTQKWVEFKNSSFAVIQIMKCDPCFATYYHYRLGKLFNLLELQ